MNSWTSNDCLISQLLQEDEECQRAVCLGLHGAKFVTRIAIGCNIGSGYSFPPHHQQRFCVERGAEPTTPPIILCRQAYIYAYILYIYIISSMTRAVFCFLSTKGFQVQCGWATSESRCHDWHFHHARRADFNPNKHRPIAYIHHFSTLLPSIQLVNLFQKYPLFLSTDYLFFFFSFIALQFSHSCIIRDFRPFCHIYITTTHFNQLHHPFLLSFIFIQRFNSSSKSFVLLRP